MGSEISEKDKAVRVLPAYHRLGVRVPKGGSSCSSCDYLASPKQCGNEGYRRWHGSKNLPAPADEYCCDLWEISPPLGRLDTYDRS